MTEPNYQVTWNDKLPRKPGGTDGCVMEALTITGLLWLALQLVRLAFKLMRRK